MFFAFFFCGWPKFLKEDMCLKTVPPFFFGGGCEWKKKIRHATKPVWRGRRRKKTKKKEKEKKFKQKEIRHSCLKEAHKVRRRSKKYRSYFRSPKITEDAPRGSRMIFPRRFYSRRVLEKDGRMDEDLLHIIGGRESEETIKREKEKRSRIKIRVKNDTMYPIK